MSNKEYIGPHYKNFVKVGGIKYDPKNFTKSQSDKFVEAYPQYAKWWHKKEVISEDDLEKKKNHNVTKNSDVTKTAEP